MTAHRGPGERFGPAADFEAELRVTGYETVADGVVALTLRDPGGRDLPVWSPGAHIDLSPRPGFERQYSLCGDPADRTAWRIAVLREPEGRGGSLLVHDELVAGARVRVRGPRNNFALAEAPGYLFIAGGIGVTPILPMVAAAEAAGASWRLVYGGRRRASMAFHAELAGYGDKVVIWPQDEAGLLPLDDELGEPRADTLVYCCGPEPLLAEVERRCGSWPEGALHVERFTARPVTEPVRAEGFEVVCERSGLTLDVAPGRSILHTAEDAGIMVLSSCQEGTCGTCETEVIEGEPDHRDSVLSESERAAGDVMMICVSRSRTPRLVLDL
ncbi:PDR/VanB family oxidoreductase [Actinomadura sp. HBU206391]|uniref:PDR/VanB family oxidoreductase n=1 Tax=Actinomadura sp. HBU206391 TaxID=2731692 RepID=UPI0016504576|nr:PDR/VanB family oxidoreductase [Actinomadura sp. HBU206391]MBC6462348.1 oxidoreductase [Actinomadura sp. HBU206391]